jgi:O-antigen/teichoic acid export membrane protein
MATLTAAEGLGRLLNFGFYILAARELAPPAFGSLRYTIVLATLGFALLQVLAWTLTRELGAARGDPDATAKVLGTNLAAAAVVLLASVLLCLAAAAAGLTGTASVSGLLVVLVGLAVFQLYYATARGTRRNTRAAVTVVGASGAQLIGFGALAALSDPSAEIAVVLFGASSLVPVLILEGARPLLRRSTIRGDRATLRATLRLATPLLAAEIGYLVWLSADQIWVESRLSARDLGIYAAAKTLAQLFVVLPSGVAGVLVPRVAELRARGADSHAWRLVLTATAALLAVSSVLAVGAALEADTLLDALYGPNYTPAASSFSWLAVAMTLYAGFSGLTTGALGWGRPGVYTAGILVAATLQVILLATLEPATPRDTAVAVAVSITGALATVAVLLALRPFRGTDRKLPEDGPDSG